MINGKKRGLKRSRFFSKLFESNRSLFAGDVDEKVDEEIYDRVNQVKCNRGQKLFGNFGRVRNTNQYDSYTRFFGNIRN